MGVEDLRGLSTIFCMIAFAAIVFWAYGPSRKKYFDEAAELPFADDLSDQAHLRKTPSHKTDKSQ